MEQQASHHIVLAKSTVQVCTVKQDVISCVIADIVWEKWHVVFHLQEYQLLHRENWSVLQLPQRLSQSLQLIYLVSGHWKYLCTSAIVFRVPACLTVQLEHCTSIFPSPSLCSSLAEEDLVDITDYLLEMEKIDVYNLGLLLGLSHHKLKTKMDSSTFLDDVIAAWLRKEDQVKKKGEPSWTVLVRALKHRRLQQTGIADDIVKDKGLSLEET